MSARPQRKRQSGLHRWQRCRGAEKSRAPPASPLVSNNLRIMLQEMMLGEEYQMIAGTSAPLATPGTPTCTVRNAQSNETALNTAFTAVKVAAINYFGSTAVSAASTTFTVSAGQVVDVTIPAVPGAMQYQIYGFTSGSSYYLLATCGGTKFTLQGFATLPTAVTPPAADTGTGKGTRIEGVVPTLAGVSASSGVYPSGWQGGYVNNAVATHLSISAVNVALKALWDSTTNSPGAFKADPAEIVSSGSDIANLAQDVVSAGAANNYLLGISQGETGNVIAGAAVTQVRNPITQSLVKMVVHPWYPQGNADILSYQLPQTWTNVSNAIEMQMVPLRPLAGQPASANPEDCWEARVTCVRYSVN